jgi:hypothetical protein
MHIIEVTEIYDSYDANSDFDAEHDNTSSTSH